MKRFWHGFLGYFLWPLLIGFVVIPLLSLLSGFLILLRVPRE